VGRGMQDAYTAAAFRAARPVSSRKGAARERLQRATRGRSTDLGGLYFHFLAAAAFLAGSAATGNEFLLVAAFIIDMAVATRRHEETERLASPPRIEVGSPALIARQGVSRERGAASEAWLRGCLPRSRALQAPRNPGACGHP
jgi:hypothetical protein